VKPADPGQFILPTDIQSWPQSAWDSRYPRFCWLSTAIHLGDRATTPTLLWLKLVETKVDQAKFYAGRKKVEMCRTFSSLAEEVALGHGHRFLRLFVLKNLKGYRVAAA
jgi:hypothetical protein